MRAIVAGDSGESQEEITLTLSAIAKAGLPEELKKRLAPIIDAIATSSLGVYW